MRDTLKVPLEAAARVLPQHVADYARGRGWRRVTLGTRDLAVYANPDDARLEQIVIPRDATLADYPSRVADIVVTLSELESRPVVAVLNDLLSPDSDTLRFAREGPTADAGSVSLSVGADMLEGAKRSLLSAACSVLQPERHHQRLSRQEADQLLSASRLNHTERGSFVIAISCPLRAVDSPPHLFEPPFTRKVTSLLMRSVHSLVQAIESDQTGALVETTLGEAAPANQLSANLCDAIVRMQSDGEDAIRVGVSWAPVLPVEEEIPTSVRIPHEYIDAIERIRDQLRPTPALRTRVLVGTVEALVGDMNDGQRSGDVILSALHEDELVRVRVALNRDQYAEADRAHMSGLFVQAEGEFNVGRRVHRLADVRRFVVLEA